MPPPGCGCGLPSSPLWRPVVAMWWWRRHGVVADAAYWVVLCCVAVVFVVLAGHRVFVLTHRSRTLRWAMVVARPPRGRAPALRSSAGRCVATFRFGSRSVVSARAPRAIHPGIGGGGGRCGQRGGREGLCELRWGGEERTRRGRGTLAAASCAGGWPWGEQWWRPPGRGGCPGWRLLSSACVECVVGCCRVGWWSALAGHWGMAALRGALALLVCSCG